MAHDDSVFVRLEAAGRKPRRITLRGGAPSDDATDVCGRYEVLGRLSEGGVGEVWRGRDVDIGRDVALKVLRAGHADSDEMMQRFVDEAQISGQLQHPGIVPVYELGLRADRRPYIAMKLVKGRTLAAMLRAGGSSRRSLLQVFEQVCRTVAYAHERGVVHRDLKPANVMVGAFGEVQVLDWGFAKVLPRGGVADERRRPDTADLTRIETQRSGEGSESVAGSVMGTPAYMPPEQALGQVDQLDERSDVFSLGAILCEILTGKPPYDGERSDIFMQAAQARLDDARERLDSCEADRDVVELAHRCLQPLRAERPANAGEVGDAVLVHVAEVEERAHRAEVAAAKTAEKAERAQEETRHQRRAKKQSIVYAAVVALAILIAGASYAVLDARSRNRERRAADLVAVAVTDAQHHLGDGAWAEARAAAEKALALARGGSAELHHRASQALAALDREEKLASEEEARRQQERVFLAELDEIRLERGEDFGTEKKTENALVDLFARHGIDIESTDAAADRIGSRWFAIAKDLADALDEWAWIRHRTNLGSEKVTALARRIEADPWRNRLRNAFLSDDAAALKALHAEASTRNDLSVRSLTLLAVALSEVHERDAADALLRRAWLVDPTDFWATTYLARNLFELESPAALRFTEAAVALRPKSAFAWHNLAHAFEIRKEYERARVAYHNAMRLAPETPHHRVCCSHLLATCGEVDRALALAREAALQDPTYAGPQRALGIILLNRKGDLADAVAAFREAIRLDPKRASSHQLLGFALHRQGDFSGALEALREAIRLDPRDARTHASLGDTLLATGDRDGAIEALRRAVALDPDYFEAHVNLGNTLCAAGDLDGAISHARAALRLKPRSADALTNLGMALCQKGDAAAAEANYREAMRVDPKHPESRYNLAMLIADRGDRAAPEALYREAIRIKPDYAEAHCNLAMVLRNRGRFAEALKWIRKGHELGSRQRRWDYPSARWVVQGERYADIERRLPEIVAAEPPQSAGDCATTAWVLYTKKRYPESARFYAAALDRVPKPDAGSLQWTAAAAVLAGTPEWRGRALVWLREVVDLFARDLAANEKWLRAMKTDSDFAAVRDRIDELPEDERAAWRKIWADIDALLEREVAK